MHALPLAAVTTAAQPPSEEDPNEFLVHLAMQSTEMSSRRLFAALVCFRVVNALLVRTYFNPDEFWQSTEVAHRLVFG